MNISFFGKKPGLSSSYGGTRIRKLVNGASIIRGMQIAEYLGAKYNPIDGFEDDICVYVKLMNHVKFSKHGYLDILDSPKIVKFLMDHPELGVIAASKSSYEYLKSHIKNHVVYIPQHHCNYENVLRDRKEIVTVGIIGLHNSFMYPIEKLREIFKKNGMELIAETKFQNRKNVCDFYRNIDVQVTWRPVRWSFKNPLKIYNAASFGIPTVGFPEAGNEEMKGFYVEVRTIDDMVKEVKKFQDKDYYDEFSKKIIKKAEEYHISKIAKLYEQLT